MIHGVLFIILCLLILIALIEGKLSFKWAVLAFIATLIPFGTFVIDRKLAFFDKE
jgi:integral membrane protein